MLADNTTSQVPEVRPGSAPTLPAHADPPEGRARFDYAPAVLCPGDPRRAEYVAKTFFDRPGPRQRGAWDARLHRHVRGPSDLGAIDRHGLPERGDRLRGADPAGRRRGCSASAPAARLQPDDGAWPTLCVAVSATPSDQTALTYTGGEPHAPTADWQLVETAARVGRERGHGSTSARSCRATSSTTPTPTASAAGPTGATSASRWRRPCCTRSRRCGRCPPVTLLTVSDTLDGEAHRAHQRRGARSAASTR